MFRRTFYIFPILTSLAFIKGGVLDEQQFDLKDLREGVRGFVEISPDRSGLVDINSYSHPERWRRLWHQYFLGTIGTGLSLGDVNGDGLADVFSVGKDSSNRLYLNQGDFVFSEQAESSGIREKSGIGAGAAMVDIDNDGDLDIYVCYTGSANELYINDGGGRFEEAAQAWGLAISTGSNAPSFSDYDKDGDLDLYLQCNFLADSGHADGMPDLLLENKGTHFVNVSETSGISGRGQGHAAVWWDYNEDGWPDLYVANDFESADRLYRNNRDGTFTDVIAAELITAPYSAMGADIGDLNNDGSAELLVGEMAASEPAKHQRTVANIETKSIFAPQYSASQYMQNMLSVRIGESQFTEISRMAGLQATDWTWAVRIADLDNDGLQDLFFTNGMIRAFHDGDLGLKSDKARTGWQRIAYFKASPLYEERNLFYRNLGDFEFEELGVEFGFEELSVSFAAAFADFDLDGDLDMVVSSLDEPLKLFENRVASGSSVSVGLRGTRSNRFGVGARARLFSEGEVYSRELTLTRGYLSSDEPLLHFGIGKRRSIDRLEIEWPSGAKQTVRDIKPNRRYRIEEEDNGFEATEEIRRPFVASTIALPRGARSAEDSYRLHPNHMLVPENESRLGPPILVADFDGDGFDDIALGGPGGLEARVLWSESGRLFELSKQAAFSDDFESEDLDLAWGDFNGDGTGELLVSSGSVELEEGDEFYRDRLYSLSSGRELKAVPVSSLDFDSSPTRKSMWIDYDGDGDLDLLQAGGSKIDAYPDFEDNRVWRCEKGRFERDLDSYFARSFIRSGNTTDLLAVDWSGDGKLDLVQAVQWGAPVFWVYQEGGLRRAVEALDGSALSGFWRALSSGDFDGDGRMDILLGNRGLNISRVPSIDEPLVLFSPKPDGLRNVFIDCFTHGGRVLPVESRILNAIQFPGLLERTTSSIADYADKDVGQIFTDAVLEQMSRHEVKETRSMILYQRETGRFSPSPLPRWAQSGAVMDSLVADYDGDGWLDVFLSLEPRAPRLWADRPLKGHVVVLRNLAGRGFATLLPKDSGLEIDGFPRHMAWSDLDRDGIFELLLTMSEGPLLIFSRNSGAE